MATTPNYGWVIPDNTSFVKDGAAAIRTVSDSIDATSAGANFAGLVLIKTQTIGTAVSSVTVSGAFSSTYDNYLVLVSGGVSSITSTLLLTIGSATTGYYFAEVSNTWNAPTPTGDIGSNVASFTRAGSGSVNSLNMNAQIKSPNLTKVTEIIYETVRTTTDGNQAKGGGFLNNSTQYTTFSLVGSSGSTMTGGLIAVYGYRKAI